LAKHGVHGYIRPRDEKSRRRPVYDVHPMFSQFSQLSQGEG
jgi:hypothetical protein